MAKWDRSVEYDPNFTSDGKPRQRYKAPTKGQQKLKKERERMEAAGLTGKVTNVKRHPKVKGESHLKHRFHCTFNDEQWEWLQMRAFREGVSMTEWVRRIVDAIRMAEANPMLAQETARRKEREREEALRAMEEAEGETAAE